jgi:hypothetical protein
LAVGADPVKADVTVEDAEAPALARGEGQVEVTVEVGDRVAFEADKVMVRRRFGIEPGLSATDRELVDPTLPLKAPENVVNGGKRHRRKAGPEGPMDLLGGRVVFWGVRRVALARGRRISLLFIIVIN